MANLPQVSDCAVADCSYNHNGCEAAAMTMGVGGCSTFIALPQVGGIGTKASVGACVKADCEYNDHLECGAEAIKVGSASGECLTYHKAA